jgi:hypothetical protein
MAKRNTPANPPEAASDRVAAPKKPRSRRPAPLEVKPIDIPDVESTPVEIPYEPTEDEIRHRAYERYLERGGGHGSEFEDWVNAEQDLRRRR